MTVVVFRIVLVVVLESRSVGMRMVSEEEYPTPEACEQALAARVTEFAAAAITSVELLSPRTGERVSVSYSCERFW